MSDFLNPHLTRPAVRWTAGTALPALEQTGPAAPLLVDATTGRLMVDTEANLTADLSLIEGKQDTTNALLTTTAADIASVKTQLATGSVAVTGGGGGGGGASAAYNSTLPTYTSGASTTLQTDVNGRLITAIPSGSATSANQVTANASLSSIVGNTSSGSTSSVSSFTSTSSSSIVSSGSRKAITIYNAGAGDLYVLLGTGTASSTNYSFVVGVSDLVTVANFTGALQGIFSATGTAQVSIIS
jgi:hypothetical protein